MTLGTKCYLDFTLGHFATQHYKLFFFRFIETKTSAFSEILGKSSCSVRKQKQQK